MQDLWEKEDKAWPLGSKGGPGLLCPLWRSLEQLLRLPHSSGTLDLPRIVTVSECWAQ